ncbi:MAG: polymer-forming cytoskeletal protein [Pseudomonadota bacterium]
MALQSPFFNNGKQRENVSDAPAVRTVSSGVTSGAQAVSHNIAASSAPSAATAAAAAGATAVQESESRLIVGPNIKLKGVEITDCDTLVVEGSVEATMDSRLMQIAARGSFKGTAEIDIAEIRGAFDGNLVVREKLTIFSTGKVSGQIRYGKIVMEEGAQLSGEIQSGASGVARTTPARPLAQVNA